MLKYSVLLLAGLSGAAAAQTPTINPMPDGSRDMYIGLGAVSAPRWDGASERKTAVLPVVQFEFSNGIFLSGMTAGWHLSEGPVAEYGPLLSLLPGRTQSGRDAGVGHVTTAGSSGLIPGTVPVGVPLGATRLYGMQDIDRRLEAGGFFNYYLAPQVRLANTLLAGSGQDRNGLRYTLDLQRVATDAAEHHRIAAAVGFTLVNRQYNTTYFGVTAEESRNSLNAEWHPGGGVRDVHASVRWNWMFTPSWMLTSQVQVARLQGDAKRSPLVERPTNVSVSTALAYRF